MEAPLRYPELFLAPPVRTPDSLWISLGYFNLYRIAVATLFLTVTVVYGGELNLGSHALELFRYVCGGYLFLAVVFQGVLRNLREHFNLQLSLHVCLDIFAMTLLMYASGGVRSGLGVMLLISLIGAAIVARGAFLLYAALAPSPTARAGYGCSRRCAERQIPQPAWWRRCLPARGYRLAGGAWWRTRPSRASAAASSKRRRASTSGDQDMLDGVAVLDRDGRWCSTTPARGCCAPSGCSAPTSRAGAAFADERGWRSGEGRRAPRRLRRARARHRTAAARHRHEEGLGAVRRGHQPQPRAGAAAQARGARAAHREHRARNPQPAGGDQPRLRAAERGEAHRRPHPADADRPRQHPASRAPGVRRAAAQPARPHLGGAHRARALSCRFVAEFIATRRCRRIASRSSGRDERSSSDASTCHFCGPGAHACCYAAPGRAACAARCAAMRSRRMTSSTTPRGSGVEPGQFFEPFFHHRQRAPGSPVPGRDCAAKPRRGVLDRQAGAHSDPLRVAPS